MATVIAFIYRTIILPNKPSSKCFTCESYKTFYAFPWSSCTLELKEDSLIAGGVVGGCTAALMSKDKFKPISEVIMHDMTHAQRERLADSVAAVIAELRVEDIALLLPLLLNSPGAKEAVLRSVFAFIQNEMKLQVVD
jgi:hypothetical protein